MIQRLKDEVRDRIVEAAAALFASRGFEATKLSDVADRAGTSTSNIYKYYDNKQALFDLIVTPALAARLLVLLRARVRELGAIDRWTDADAAGSHHAHALLSFWVEHRFAVLILLRGAAGTRYDHVRGLMIGEMQRLAARHLRERQDGSPVPPAMDFVLERLFVRTVDMIADILQAYDRPAEIAHAFGLFWRYQLAGLQSLLAPVPDRAGRAGNTEPDGP